MNLEILIFLLCTGDYACDEALKMYYAEKPIVRKLEEKTKKEVRRYIRKEAIIISSVVYSFVNESNYRFRITKNLSLKCSNNDISLSLQYNF